MSINKLILSVETTIRGGSISLLDDTNEIDFRLGSGEVSKASDILLMIEDLLNTHNIKKNSLRLITISNRFGSFTGARVGWALAKGLKKSLGCKIIGVSLLEAMCLIDVGSNEKIVCIPKGSREVCFQEFGVKSKDSVFKLDEPQFSRIESFDELICKNFKKHFILENNLYGLVMKNSFIVSQISRKKPIIIRADKNLAKYIGILGQTKVFTASDNNITYHY